VSRAPVPDQEANVLKALVLGLCALVLASQAAAASTRHHPPAATHTAKKKRMARTLDERLDHELRLKQHERELIVFYETHPRLLASRGGGKTARRSLHRARVALKRCSYEIAGLRRAIRIRDARRLAKASPRAAICTVFGSYCHQAINVAWCESRLQTTAQNGQYLGLFQMGFNARARYGHGPDPWTQAEAAFRYFADSGFSWGPWQCKP